MLGHLGIGRGLGPAGSVHRRWVSSCGREGGVPRSELQVAYEDQCRHGVTKDGARMWDWTDC